MNAAKIFGKTNAIHEPVSYYFDIVRVIMILMIFPLFLSQFKSKTLFIIGYMAKSAYR